MAIDFSRGTNWLPAAFLVVYHLTLFAGLPIYLCYTTPPLSMWILAFVLMFISGLCITGGYHRLYSHKAYRAHPIAEGALLTLATLAGQGSALRWCFDHRLHHAYVDTDKDPYSIKKGFWYAHMLWLFEKPRPIDPKVVPDLLKNRMIVFQNRYYPLLFIGSLFALWAPVAWFYGDGWGAFLIVGLLRLFTLHHCTWFINSLAHTFGSKPFCQEQSAVNNFILAFLTFGEGYHNYHHTFANDYRNGIRWYHFDPTKWLIWTLSKLQLASGLKEVDQLTIQRKMVLERKNLLQGRLQELWYVKKDELEQTIQEISERMIQEIANLKELRQKLRSSNKSLLPDLKQEFKALKKNLKRDWRLWHTLSKAILKMRPVPKSFSPC